MSYMPTKEMKTIGLTGIMGAGKSTAIKILKEEGITVLDCDQINAQLLQQKEKGYCELIQTFGDSLLDENNDIDKKKMSNLIFSNIDKKKIAEAILHPLIKQKIKLEIQKHKDEELIVVEVPLLFEVHWESFFDEVWVVSSKEDILLDRLEKYRNISKDEAKRRLAHQMPLKEKEARADVVLYNNSDRENFKSSIRDILKTYRG